MTKLLKQILEKSVIAPSGDNSQPWRFKIIDSNIYVYLKPDIDLPFYNYEQKGSLFANGCVIENILISATNFGFDAKLSLFPDPNQPDLTAIVNLKKNSNIKKDPLFDFIEKRITNRKFYKNIPLSESQKNDLIESVKNIYQDARIVFVDNKNDIKKAAKAFVINEQIVLETEQIHKAFFEHVVWTEEEERNKKSGLYVKTLEMKKPEELVFKLCKNWKIMNFLNKFGMSKFIANENAKRFMASSALCAIITKNNTKEDFVYAGRISQRFWLKATSMGLSLHPITGVLYLMQRVLADQAEAFQSYVPQLITSYEIIKKIFHVQNETIPFIFRIGFADPPSAKSSKLPPEIIS